MKDLLILKLCSWLNKFNIYNTISLQKANIMHCQYETFLISFNYLLWCLILSMTNVPSIPKQIWSVPTGPYPVQEEKDVARQKNELPLFMIENYEGLIQTWIRNLLKMETIKWATCTKCLIFLVSFKAILNITRRKISFIQPNFRHTWDKYKYLPWNCL